MWDDIIYGITLDGLFIPLNHNERRFYSRQPFIFDDQGLVNSHSHQANSNFFTSFVENRHKNVELRVLAWTSEGLMFVPYVHYENCKYMAGLLSMLMLLISIFYEECPISLILKHRTKITDRLVRNE